jgi:hypothetical protein
MEMILLDKDLWLVVDGTNVRPSTTNGQSAWDRRDQRARASLITNLKDNQMHLVISAKTSMQVWDKLATIFETKDITSNVFPTICFYSKKMSETESVEKHLSSFNVSRTQLEAIGTALVDEQAQQ